MAKSKKAKSKKAKSKKAKVAEAPAPVPKPKKVKVNMNCAVIEVDAGVYDEAPFGDDAALGTHVYARAGIIQVGGRSYSHVGEDAHGRWTYRRV